MFWAHYTMAPSPAFSDLEDSMDIGLATSIMAAKQGSTREQIALSVIKQQHQQDLSLVQMLDDAVRSAPPPGQGGTIDKSA